MGGGDAGRPVECQPGGARPGGGRGKGFLREWFRGYGGRWSAALAMEMLRRRYGGIGAAPGGWIGDWGRVRVVGFVGEVVRW